MAVTFRRSGDAIDHAQCEADRTGKPWYVMGVRDAWLVTAVRGKRCVVVRPIMPDAYRQAPNGSAQRGAHSAKRPEV